VAREGTIRQVMNRGNHREASRPNARWILGTVPSTCLAWRPGCEQVAPSLRSWQPPSRARWNPVTGL